MRPNALRRAFEKAQDRMLGDFSAFASGATRDGGGPPHVTSLKVRDASPNTDPAPSPDSVPDPDPDPDLRARVPRWH